MGQSVLWQPATTAERYRAIDIIRGLALFGVLIINLLTDFRVPLLEHILHPDPGPGRANHIVEAVAMFALEFKAFTTFSFLFGVGIAIQADRAAARMQSIRPFLLRRFGWLLVLGATHLLLIWNGDILTLYAVCGFLLLPLLGMSPRVLVLVGALLIALPEFAWFGIDFPSGSAATSVIAETRKVYGSGDFFAILRFRWQETWTLIRPIMVAVLPRTAALMYWGVAAWRSGILREPEKHRKALLAVLAIGGVLGPLFTLKPANHVDATILLAAAYVSALLLWLTPKRTAQWPGIAALGQMALTNYLFQSIVLGFVFYGFGLGRSGRMGSAATASLGLGIYIVQIQLSRLWLSHFRFGPFEWLWRSLAYGHPQTMVRRFRSYLADEDSAKDVGHPVPLK